VAEQKFLELALVGLRVSGLVIFLPLLGGGLVPRMVKVLFAVGVTVAVFPFAGSSVRAPAMGDPALWVLFAAGELVLGAALGFAARLALQAVRFAGELLGRQMGMALANMSNPATGTKATVVGNFCHALAVLTFFTVGGHRWLVRGIARSFRAWPVGSFPPLRLPAALATAAARWSFAAAFQIAAPLLILTFAITLVMALTARLVQEINVLILGFPMRIGMGMLGLLLFLPMLSRCAVEVSRKAGQLFLSAAGAS